MTTRRELTYDHDGRRLDITLLTSDGTTRLFADLVVGDALHVLTDARLDECRLTRTGDRCFLHVDQTTIKVTRSEHDRLSEETGMLTVEYPAS